MRFSIRSPGFLGTQVGRRTLLHFLGAALIPVLVSSLLGIWFVRETLIREAEERVERTTKSAASTLLHELTTLARETMEMPLSALDLATITTLRDEESAHLDTRRVLLQIPPAAANPESDSIRMLRRLSDGRVAQRVMPATILWSALDELVNLDRTSICIFTVRSWERVHCSEFVTPAVEARLRELAIGVDAREVDGSSPRTSDLLVAHRDAYLRFEFGSAELRLVSAEARSVALAPARSVTISLALLIAIAMVGAFALAHRQIRRSTAPLEALRDATRRFGAGELDTTVSIASRDEYGELGISFNRMTQALGSKVSLLRLMDEVDQSTLRDQEVESIAKTALEGFRQTFPGAIATVSMLDERGGQSLTQWSLDDASTDLLWSWRLLSGADRALLLANPRQLVFAGAAAREESLAPPAASSWIAGDGRQLRVCLPLLHDGELLGAITLDCACATTRRDEQLLAARRLADRVALGVANVRLLNRLEALSSGTLLAFARAIDANSPWTAGHSERVTKLALALGRQLELSPAELSTLYRGGIMHDIGKIGIPPAVLDKASRLDDAERALIEKHPEIGERILRPIPAFTDALAIVRSHHEKMDGTGYPDRLVGESIPWLARILAVADVFDALVSDRPYRAGLSHRAAMTMIESNAGTHFDVRVVEALQALERDNMGSLTSVTELHEFPLATATMRNTPSALVAVN